MTKEQLMEILWNDFKNDASVIIRKYVSPNKMQNNCNRWGSCFTAIPDGVTYQDIKQIIDSEVD